MSVLLRTDPRYPPRLLGLTAPPEPLWWEGDVSLLSREGIAIVGTRRMTPYGERVARELATAIAQAGVVVVSGLAQGIDSAAHAAALDARGDTVAVLGEGLAAFDPQGRRRRLASVIRDRGCLVSQYEPLVPAQGWMFAKRNATIAALARAVVVVEAPHGSGALITAADGLALGREVYAAPGPLGAAASAGSNELIASGRARALTGPESLGLIDQRTLGLTTSPAAHDAVLERLAAGPASPDVLRADPEHVAELLLSGHLVRLPDGRLART